MSPGTSACRIAATLAVLWAAAASDATVRQAASVADGVRHADLIVRGKITARLPDADRDFHYGALEVSEVVYGPANIAKVTLVLSYTSDGPTFDIGDEGIFFLRAKPPAGRQQLTVGPTPGPIEHLGHLPFSHAFVADGPDACWADNDAFYTRNREAARPDASEVAARRRAMYEAVRDRLRAEAAQLRAALERNAANAKRAEAALAPPSRPAAP